LIATADAMHPAPSASTAWLDQLAGIADIDPGEALLLASAAEHSLKLITGDKRALTAVARVHQFPPALSGRIVCFEAAMLLLCERLGDDRVRTEVAPLIAVDDITLKICFSESNPHPREGLRSYMDDLSRGVHPIVLWDPTATWKGA
jgi:hypothetical protein